MYIIERARVLPRLSVGCRAVAFCSGLQYRLIFSHLHKNGTKCRVFAPIWSRFRVFFLLEPVPAVLAEVGLDQREEFAGEASFEVRRLLGARRYPDEREGEEGRVVQLVDEAVE